VIKTLFSKIVDNRTFLASESAIISMHELIAARICLLSLSLLTISIVSINLPSEQLLQIEFIYTPIALLLGFCAMSLLAIKRREPGKLFKTFQVIFDIILATGIIYITGSSESPFLFLFILINGFLALFFNLFTSIIISFLIGASYYTLVYLEKTGYIPLLNNNILNRRFEEIIIQLANITIGMILVSVLINFQKHKLKDKNSQLSLKDETLLEINFRNQMILNTFSEGVVLTDEDGSITVINPSGAHLFSLNEESQRFYIGKNINQLLSSLGSILDENEETLREEALYNKDTIKELHTHSGGIIHFHEKILRNSQNECWGRLYIFSDVTKLKTFEEHFELQEKMMKLLAKASSLPHINNLTAPQLIVGESTQIKKVFELIDKVAATDSNVLVTGESGTGKEVAAKTIHLQSLRGRAPFIAVNCGAIPENLLESELFGHRKGSFTSADHDHKGLIRRAEGGTLFLDEIGEIPLNMQSKLLRTIQEKMVLPVGGEAEIPVDVRIIAATNRNLLEEVKKGTFREDLYYRLNVIQLHLPPLRERPEDIPLLIAHFYNKKYRRKDLHLTGDKKHSYTIAPAALQLLLKYNYPGNIRELENIIERAFVLGGEVLLAEHLPFTEYDLKISDSSHDSGARNVSSDSLIMQERNMSPRQTRVIEYDHELPLNLEEILDAVEKKYILIALEKAAGKKKKAAELLGINFRSLRYRLQKFGLDDESIQH
jgi:transcriptional regulator with PAS, ATPase and Fis domain